MAELRACEVSPLNCTGATVRRLARRMTSFYEQRLQPCGLKLSQYSLLANLSEQPQSLLALSRRMEMDRTTLTRNLKPLLASRWVAETRGDDARQRLLVLTARGKRVRQQARDSWKTAQLALEKQLGAASIARLHAELDQALEKLKAVLPDEN
jgi:DNA-binding MarR family transcriptional regulator